MTANNNSRDAELLYELGCLRYIKRMWQRLLNPDFANVTEHSFRVAWIALMLSTMEKSGNQEKIIKIAMVHDLPESRCGDVDYIARMYTDRHEERAIHDIFSGTSLEKEMVSMWEECEKRQSIEAKIVKDADNLDVELELQEQGARGHAIQNIWKTQRKKAVYTKLYTKSGRKLWEAIHASNPFDWHLKGRNRLNHGDWKIKQRKPK